MKRQFFAILSVFFILMTGFGMGVVAAEDTGDNSTVIDVTDTSTDDSNNADDSSTIIETTNNEEYNSNYNENISVTNNVTNIADSGVIISSGGVYTNIDDDMNSTYTENNTYNSNYSSDDDTNITDNSQTEITKIEAKNVNIDNSQDTNIKFTDNSVVNNINFVSKESGNTKVIIKEVVEKPPVENVYKSFNIWIDNVNVNNNMENAAVDFKVEKSWLIANGLDKSSIVLNMYNNGKWIEVPVTITSEDSQYVYFNAKVSGYSTFAISSKAITVDKVLKQENVTKTSASSEEINGTTKNVIVKLLKLIIELLEGK